MYTFIHMKKIVLFLMLLAITLVIPRIRPAAAQQPPKFQLYFSPGIWVKPGNPVRLTAEIINPDSADLADATVTISFNGGTFFTNPTITSESGFTCIMRSTLAYTHMQATCSGGTVKAGQTVQLGFDDYAPAQILYSYGIPMQATGHLAPAGLSASDSLLVVNSYLPDFAVGGTVSHLTSLVGQPITYTVDVLNLGALGSPPARLEARFPNGTSETKEIPAMGVGPNQKTVFTFVYTPTAAGTAKPVFTINPNNTVAESSPTNNTYAPATAVSESLPDLTVNQIQPATVPLATAFTRTVTVRNSGNAPANNFAIRDLFFNTGLINISASHGLACLKTYTRIGRSARTMLNGYQCTGGSLNPGESADINVRLTSPAYKAVFTNNIGVDSGKIIKESSETNNSTSGSFTTL